MSPRESDPSDDSPLEDEGEPESELVSDSIAPRSGAPVATVRRARVSVSRRFEGPLPPPDMLAQYEQVKPGMAERIVVLLEQESSHRRESFDKEQRHTHITERIGQWLTATLTAGGIGVAGYAVACGSAGAAATIVVALFSVGGVVFSLKNRGSRQRDSGER